MPTQTDLHDFIKKNLKGRKFVVALNSEPYVHYKTSNGIAVKRGSGGAQNLHDGILKTVGGLMVAVASGNADHQVVDSEGKIKVPPGKETYSLKRLFLSKEELDGYYYGFSNQTLWPLCHMSFVKPLFEHTWWKTYKRVNEKFAEAIIKEIGKEKAFVWVNDYQLCLLPKMLKEKNPDIKVGTFWHIPWPIHTIYNICPWKNELLEGLLGSDFIGFHDETYVHHFMECAIRDLKIDVLPSSESMLYKGNITRVGTVPAGVDYEEIKSNNEAIATNEDTVKDDFEFEYKYLSIGVDRVDYTKGLLERLYIIDTFLNKYPEFRKQFVHLMIGAPSRIHIPIYKQLNRDVIDVIEKINWKYSINGWQPIQFINKSFPRERIFSYYRCADICMVSSLDDGMNLVAKEYVLCSQPDKGVLLLSRFTGAARELTDALIINPYDTSASADLLHKALTMKPSEKLHRNNNMRKILKDRNIYNWAIDFIRNTVDV